MGGIKTIKRLAASILKVGVNRVRIKNSLNESEKKQLDEAITKVNIRDLIKDKVIFAIEKKGRKKKQKKKRRTTGKKRGKLHSKISEKERWMERVRAQRKYLKKLITEKKVDSDDKRNIYLKIKGGSFRSKQAMHTYLKDNKLLKKE